MEIGEYGAATHPRSGGERGREFELLCSAARLAPDAAAQARIGALVQSGIDWSAVIALGRKHHVLPLLDRTLKHMHPGVIPEEPRRRLRGIVQANARRNLFLTSELFQLLELLRCQGIRAIPYKGPAVASMLYDDLSLRQFADLDVVVRVEHVPSAVCALETRGYRLERDRSAEALRACLRSEKDVTLLRKDGRVNLEIHWSVTTDRDPIRIPSAVLWDGLAPVSLAGTPVDTFGPERLLLLLCIHGAKHQWEKLGWICDVAEFIRSQTGFDWDGALEQATTLGGRRIVLLGVQLAKDLLGAQLPQSLAGAIEADPAVKTLSSEIQGWLVDDSGAALDLGERERYFMRLREGRADRCRVALKQARQYLAPTLRDREALPVPGYLNWSLYLVRPVRLVGEYGLAPVKRFFSGLFQA